MSNPTELLDLPHVSKLLYNALNDAYQSGSISLEDMPLANEALRQYGFYRSARRAQPEGEAPQAVEFYRHRPDQNWIETTPDRIAHLKQYPDFEYRTLYTGPTDKHAERIADWTGVEKRGVFLGQHGAPGGWHMKAGRHDGVATLFLGHHGYVELNGKFNVELTAERCKVMHEAAQSQGAQAAPIQRRVADMVRTPLTAADFSPESAQAGRKLMDAWNADAKTRGVQAAQTDQQFAHDFMVKRNATLAAQQAAAPEDVDLRKDEATRLRRVVRAMGIDHQVPGNDARLRDCLFSVLGIIAGKLESAPGTPEAPKGGA